MANYITDQRIPTAFSRYQSRPCFQIKESQIIIFEFAQPNKARARVGVKPRRGTE